MGWTRMRLAGRLGVTHGVLVALLVLLLVVTLQGLLRMLGVMTGIAEERFATLDADEELYRAAWTIDVELRHARSACAEGAADGPARARLIAARSSFAAVLARAQPRSAEPPALRDAALRYQALSGAALENATCEFLGKPATEERRTKLDEEMTDAWIDRLHELQTDIEEKETSARVIGNRTATGGLMVALFGIATAIYVARVTARSVTRPIARLGRDATRLGDGDFTPIAAVDGPPEIDDLRRDLERTREKLLSVDTLKQAFLANVSHELRSPLGRLREALALLGDGTVGPLAPKQERVLAVARRACEQEVSIVEALLDMSRISTGLAVQRAAARQLDTVVAAAVEAEQTVAAERGVRIVVEQRTSPPPLRLDAALVERAVANLIRNAVSVSSRDGTVRVLLDVPEVADARSSAARARVVRLDVVDDGPGVTAEVANRIFQPFNPGRVGDRPAGIGLGLSLAREVARAHGGDVVLVHGAPSTTFRMEFPVDDTKEEP